MALTKSDKNWVKNTVESAMEEQEQRFEAKIEEVKDDFYNKITEVKDDFYNKIDPILKEVVASQEERTILSHQVSGHEDRIEKIEKKLSITPAL